MFNANAQLVGVVILAADASKRVALLAQGAQSLCPETVQSLGINILDRDFHQQMRPAAQIQPQIHHIRGQELWPGIARSYAFRGCGQSGFKLGHRIVGRFRNGVIDIGRSRQQPPGADQQNNGFLPQRELQHYVSSGAARRQSDWLNL